MAGIICPHCKTADNYASAQGGPGKGNDSWSRRKACKSCGAIFETIEMPVGLIKAGTTVAGAETAAPAAEVKPVVPVTTEESKPAANSIFNQ